MVDIQSATTEIRRGKKRKKKEETTGQNIMSASARQGGHNYIEWCGSFKDALSVFTS